MVAHHEAAHLELNYVTAYGLLLRAVGRRLGDAAAAEEDGRLGELVDLCRTTHEVFATTTGVWRAPGDFGQALVRYPGYRAYFEAGRSLAGTLREGSYAAQIAMTSACWAAMQPPLGGLLNVNPLDDLDAEKIPKEFRPDLRLAVLLESKFDPITVDVALPDSWREEELREADLRVPRLHETFVSVASAYYQAFAEILVEAGLSTYAFDGHKSDPALHEWLERHPTRLGETIFFRPGEDGNDRFWPVTLSDGERVLITGRDRLVPVHLADLPINGSDETLGLDSFVGGPTELSSLLVVVRPVRTLFKQYRISDEGGALLRAAATDGIVTALRVRVESEAGEPVTLLGVFTSRKQVQDLAGLPTSHGILASICETCSWFPNWSHYWAPALMRATHTVRLVDLPRRLWLDGLEAEGAPPNCRGFTIGKDADQSGLAGLFIWFDDHYAPADPPLLVVGSQRTVAAISSALGALFGSDVFSAGQPPEWEKTMVLVRRLVEAEPWFDARSLEDLPDFAKMGDLYQRAALIAQG